MEKPPVGTLARGFALLRAFGGFDEVLSTGELAQRTGMALPTVSRIAARLTELGVLARARPRGRYRLGVTLLALSHNIQANLRSPADLNRAALDICQQFDIETCVSLHDGNDMLAIEVFSPPRRDPTWLFTGDTFPMVSTATGRAYLAALNAAIRDALVGDIRAADPTVSQKDVDAMRRAVAKLPRDGFCASFQEYDKDSLAVAVPILGVDGLPAYVLTAIGETAEVNRRWLVQDVAPVVVEAVKPLQWRFLASHGTSVLADPGE